MLYKKELIENNRILLLENKKLKEEVGRLRNIIRQVYEVFITSGNHFEDACDCIQIEEIITKYLKDSDKE